jgi:hypothetical protein
MNICSGEKIQNLCEFYVGTKEQLNCNPFVKTQHFKHVDIDSSDICSTISNMNSKNLLMYYHN